MSLLRKMVKAVSAALQGGPSIPDDLAVLDKVQPGLARKARDYIAGEGDATVLSTLAQKPGDLKAGTSAMARSFPGVAARREYFLDPEADPDLIERYMRVLAASLQARGRPFRELPTTDAVPWEVLIFLAELKQCYDLGLPASGTDPSLRKAAPKWPNARMMEMVTRLGGGPEDVFDAVFFNDTNYYSGRGMQLGRHMDMAALARAHPQAFVAQNARLPLQGRERLFDFIAAEALAAEPPFDAMVIEALGDGSKAIREAAMKGFVRLHPLKREAVAADLLDKGKVEMRGSMVEVLIGLNSDTARRLLERHLEGEKTARIRTMIEAYLGATGPEGDPAEEAPEGVPGYRALDGSFVEIPPMRLPEDGTVPEPDAADKARLLALGQRLEDRYQADLKAERPPYYLKYAEPLDPAVFQRHALSLLQTGELADKDLPKEVRRRLFIDESLEVLGEIMAGYPQKRILDMAIRGSGAEVLTGRGYSGREKLFQAAFQTYLASDAADLRFVEAELIRLEMQRTVGPQQFRAMRPGDALYQVYLKYRNDYFYRRRLTRLADAVVWPLVAEQLWVVERALGIGTNGDIPESREAALEMLGTLPALPQRFGGPLVDLALNGSKFLQKEARKLLNRSGGFEGLLIALIGDSRQDIRAGAAKWLGERGVAEAVAPLQKRLKTEKSAVARAAILAALEALGQDISAHVGPKALLKEAEAGLKKASFKDVDWLDLETLPKVQYRDGGPVPQEVLTWWIALAVKLKAPGETALFDLYLDQLRPEDAAMLSGFLFDAWIGHDLAPMSEAEVDAQARQRRASLQNYWYAYYPGTEDLSEEEKLEILRRQARAVLPNSGAASKGLLALAGHVPSGHAVAKVRSYLRQHGRRTSQATSLLELMAAKGDAMSLQVVIAAATRLRQKGVQAKAAEMVQAAAERNDWTMDQLGDRTVPTGGLDDDGQLELVCAGGARVYAARLDEKLGLTLFNPDGKPVKALPAGDDEETKAAKKALMAAKKEIKQAIGFQSNRLFEAMCVGRRWSVADWQADFHDHPLMRKLIERLIWQGLDGEGVPVGAFRPTPEGEFIDAADADVDLAGFAAVRLAHGSTLSAEEAASWRAHLKDYEVAPLFDQVRADLPRLSEEMRQKTEIDDRLGWVYDAFTLRGEADRAGYERGDALDGGGFDCYVRHFASEGIVAVIEFTGNHVQQENIPVALKTLFFERLQGGQTRGYGADRKLTLGEVPAVMLAECWADLHRIAGKASFDPNWEKVAPW
jgi:hypothetical protein